MNIQALMKKAQEMQKNIMNSKKEIENKKYVGESQLVSITMDGKRTVLSVNIKDKSNVNADDLEILEDMIAIAFNDATKKIDTDIKNNMGNQVGPFSDLF